MKYKIKTVTGKSIEIIGFGVIEGTFKEVELTNEQKSLLKNSGLIIISSKK